MGEIISCIGGAIFEWISWTVVELASLYWNGSDVKDAKNASSEEQQPPPRTMKISRDSLENQSDA